MGGRAAHTVESKALVRIGAAMGQAAQLPPPKKNTDLAAAAFFWEGLLLRQTKQRSSPPPKNTDYCFLGPLIAYAGERPFPHGLCAVPPSPLHRPALHPKHSAQCLPPLALVLVCVCGCGCSRCA
jgi:hypothetical protein